MQPGSISEFESKNHHEYLTNKNLEKDVYEALQNYTNIKFLNNRRKPNKEDFNEYYTMLLDKLQHKYNRCELIVTLSPYFTDNLFNMFKLLDKKYATGIILELKEKGYLKDIGDINFV